MTRREQRRRLRRTSPTNTVRDVLLGVVELFIGREPGRHHTVRERLLPLRDAWAVAS